MGDPYRAHIAPDPAPQKPTQLVTPADLRALCRWLDHAGFHAVPHTETGRVVVWVDGADDALLAGLEEEFSPLVPCAVRLEFRAGADR